MISDLDENEDDSELAVEKLGLKDINDLGPPELLQADTSFGMEQAVEPQKVAIASHYSASSNSIKP